MGWWISMYDDAAKLSYEWSVDTVFEENTTLYALWQAPAGAPGLQTSIVHINGNRVDWNEIAGAISYNSMITGPEEFTSVNTTVVNAYYNVAFSTIPEGNYMVTVTAVAANSANNSNIMPVYYKNKALARVSLFEVKGSTLIFNIVKNATKYLISIECGDPLHNHNGIDLGAINFYDFSNCAMPLYGIKFTVAAQAAGYAGSVSRVFIFSRALSPISSFYLDGDTQTLHWNAVPDAERYIVSVMFAGSYIHENIDVGNKTEFCVKECPAGEIKIYVYAKAYGWGSPRQADLHTKKQTLQRRAISALKEIRFNGIQWLARNLMRCKSAVAFIPPILTALNFSQAFCRTRIMKSR